MFGSCQAGSLPSSIQNKHVIFSQLYIKILSADVTSSTLALTDIIPATVLVQISDEDAITSILPAD